MPLPVPPACDEREQQRARVGLLGQMKTTLICATGSPRHACQPGVLLQTTGWLTPHRRSRGGLSQ